MISRSRKKPKRKYYPEVTPPGPNWVPLRSFSGSGGLTFEQIVDRLKRGSGPIEVVTIKKGRRRAKCQPVQGLAVEVDESGIIRVIHKHRARKTVVVLVTKQEDGLYGEFADQ